MAHATYMKSLGIPTIEQQIYCLQEFHIAPLPSTPWAMVVQICKIVIKKLDYLILLK